MYRLSSVYQSQIFEFFLDSLNTMIGREPSCQIIVDHPSVSKQHALLEVEGDILFINDLSSDTGTFVNSEKITHRTKLIAGDNLRIGDRIFNVEDQISDDASATMSIRKDSKRPAGPPKIFPSDAVEKTTTFSADTVKIDSKILEAEAKSGTMAQAENPFLIIRDNPDYAIPVALAQPEVTIGRGKTNTIRLKDKAVSIDHCRFVKRKGRIYIYDENSLNGTFVNATKIRGVPLNNGDLILAGTTVMKFVDPTAPETNANLEEVEEKIAGLKIPYKKHTPMDPAKRRLIMILGGAGIASVILLLILYVVYT